MHARFVHACNIGCMYVVSIHIYVFFVVIFNMFSAYELVCDARADSRDHLVSVQVKTRSVLKKLICAGHGTTF